MPWAITFGAFGAAERSAGLIGHGSPGLSHSAPITFGAGSGIDMLRPQKQPCRVSVDRYRSDKQRYFNQADSLRAAFAQDQKHPRQQLNRVSVRNLPSAGIAVEPQHERQNRD